MFRCNIGFTNPMAFYIFLVLSLCASYHEVYGRSDAPQEKELRLPKSHDLKKKLLREYDDFKCVDMYKQPAFKHPLLKDHKIQVRPSFLTNFIKNGSSYVERTLQVDGLVKGCPQGKVPIQRIKMNHQRNNDFSSKSQVDKMHSFSKDRPGHHFATLDTTKNTLYHGASADINLYNPIVQTDQFSMALIWLQNGRNGELNSISVGWAVHPTLYGDNRTRLIAHWTADGYRKTGCYNVKCPGFVQVSHRYYLGQDFPAMSIIGALQYNVPIKVRQDQSTGHWWLSFPDDVNDMPVGYWPKELFTHLGNGASLVKYGGTTHVSFSGISPPMGSGELPSAKFGQACYFAVIKVVDAEYKEIDIYPEDTKIFRDTGTNCYDLLYRGDQGPEFKQAFLFGGPGGQCGT